VRIGADKTLCKDKFGTKIILFRNPPGDSYDLMTDWCVYLSTSLARKLAAELLKFAADAEKPAEGAKS